MFFIVYLARDFGITPVTAMIGFTIIIHYGINFFFLLVFTK
jgi:ribosomal protein S19